MFLDYTAASPVAATHFFVPVRGFLLSSCVLVFCSSPDDFPGATNIHAVRTYLRVARLCMIEVSRYQYWSNSRVEMKHLFCSLAIAFTLSVLPSQSSQAAEWSVPMGGNAFHTAPKPSREGFRRNGAIKWSSPKSVFSVYFHVNQPADLLLKIHASGSDGRSRLRASIGEDSFEVAIEESEKRVYDVGPLRFRPVTFESTCRALIERVERSPTFTT